jgi:phosphoribosyl 1,2-cyclic phosphate phosphodiesterase
MLCLSQATMISVRMQPGSTDCAGASRKPCDTIQSHKVRTAIWMPSPFVIGGGIRKMWVFRNQGPFACPLFFWGCVFYSDAMETSSTERQSQLILLGTGTSNGVPMIGCHCDVCESTNPKNQRSRSGVLVQGPAGNFLIDTPPEVRLQLIREKIDSVRAAVFTHGHADHLFGLDDLRIFSYYQKEVIPIYCEAETENRIRKSFDYAFSDPAEARHFGAVPQFSVRPIGIEPFELLGLWVRPIRLWHGEMPVLGYRINNVAFCTDVSRIPDESWPLLEGLDVLVLDALREKPHPTHFSLSQAIEVAERLEPRQTYFTHVSHMLEYQATNARLPPGMALAYDGLRIPLG